MHKVIEDLNWRYAVKKYDPSKKLTEEQVNVIKESLRLVPTSYGLQPLKYLIIQDEELRVNYKWHRTDKLRLWMPLT
ncbi:MAG: nitroreductase family protein [Crocinitomicaceae bacterium]